MTESLIRPRPRRWGWLIPTCLVAVVWSLTATFEAFKRAPVDGPDVMISYLLGSMLGSVALVGAVMTGVHYLLFLRKPAGELLGRHAMFIFGAALLGAVPALAMAGMIVASSGDNAEYRALNDQFVGRVEARQSEAEAQIVALVGDSLLDPSRLSQPGGLDQAYKDLDAIREIYRELEAYTREEMATFRTRIQESDTASFNRDRALGTLDEEMEVYGATLDHIWQTRMQTLDELGIALDILARRPRRWEVHGGQFAFYRNQDLQAFNAQMIKIQKMEEEIASLTAMLPGAPPRTSPRRVFTQPG